MWPVDEIDGLQRSGDDRPSFFIIPDNSAHNVYYVKLNLSDAKRFSGRRYYFRVPEHKASPLS